MTESENMLMKQLGIKAEQRTIFLYEGHKYEKIEDAINYAEIDQKRKAS
jgi:hypothetical protein